jgi:hypothetical protein
MDTDFAHRLALAPVVAGMLLTVPLGHAERLTRPIVRQSFPDAFASRHALPKWSGDVLISWRPATTSSDSADNIVVQNRDAKVVLRHRLWFPDATAVRIWDVAASRETTVAVVGHAVDKSGVFVAFVAFLSLQTPQVRIVQTSPFEGRYVVWGPNGMLWVLGYRLAETRKLLKAPPHAILHQYDQNGVLLRQTLEWPAIQCGLHPLLSWAQLAASNDRVGILLPACSTWLEVSATGNLIGRWQATLPPDYAARAQLWTPALTTDNQVYCHVSHPDHRSPEGTVTHSGMFRLNRDQKVWEPVDTTETAVAAGQLSWLAGIDNDVFVYRVGAHDMIWVARAAP